MHIFMLIILHNRFGRMYIVQVEKVLGINTAAGRAGVAAGDVLVEVEGQLVTMMTHPQVPPCPPYRPTPRSAASSGACGAPPSG